MSGCVKFLPDYATQKNGGKDLQKVGIRKVPMYRLDFNDLRVLTYQSAYVNLITDNGIHMSRLVEVLMDWEDHTIRTSADLLTSLANSHDTNNAYWECEWVIKHILPNEQPVYVDVALEGVLKHNTSTWFLTVWVPYASVCPCSAAMTKGGSGHPHMQRATAKITVQLDDSENLNDTLTWLVAEICSTVGLVPLPLMKRTDELEWCENAGRVNLFVEDAVRGIASMLDDEFPDWVVVCEHEESIHQHNVVATCNKGVKLI